MTTDKIFFDLTEGKLMRQQITEVPVDPSGLAGLVQNSTIFLSPLMRPGAFVALGPTSSDLVIVTLLRDIPFRVSVNVGTDRSTNEPVYIPDYRDVSGIKSDSAKLVFNPPDGQLLLLYIDPSRCENFIFAMDENDGTLYFPGIPNVYETGALCTGDADLPPESRIWAGGIEDYLEAWLAAWSTCDFNDDLNDQGYGSVERVCKFDIDTGKNIPLDGWESVQQRIAPEHREGSILAAIHERMKLVNS